MNNFIKTLVCVILLGVIAGGGWLLYDKVVKPNIKADKVEDTQKEETTDKAPALDNIEQIVIDTIKAEGGANE